MTSRAASAPAGVEPAVLIYLLACLGGLVLILLPQSARGVGVPELILGLLGLLGAVTRWRMAPVVLLALVGVFQLSPLLWGGRESPDRAWTFPVDDLMLCCGVLAYVVGHYRLQGLSRSLLPPDPRWKTGKSEPQPRLKESGRPGYFPRHTRLVTPGELLLFALGLPAWALAAQLFWVLLKVQGSVLDFLPVRLLILAWLLGIGGLVVGSFLNLWRQLTMTQEEAELVLQDALWRETRREQRRVTRWLAWSRQGKAQREELP
jgi:hypothetical protein